MRTTMDRITRQPLMIELGGKEYPFHPKCIRDAEMWRKELIKSFSGVFDAIISQNEINEEKLLGVMGIDLIKASENILTLMQQWEPSLPWEQIQQDAYWEELLDGFVGVIMMAFPLFDYVKTRLPTIISGKTDYQETVTSEK